MLAIASNTCLASTLDIENHWAYTDIKRCMNNDYIVGYPDGTFKPNNYIKWNEFIKIVVSIMEDNVFYNSVNWEKPYIDYAINNKLITNERDSYNEYITRGEVANILYTFLTIYGVVENTSDLPSTYLQSKNILKGYEDNTLRLDNNITRAEAVVLLNRTIDLKNEYIYNHKFDINVFKNEDVYNYTNYKNESSIFLNTYNIKNEKVYYSDVGRYDIYKDIYISQYNDVVIDILLELMDKENYVLNTYIKENKSIIIALGSNGEYVSNGSALFEIILFEEKQKIGNYEYKIKINVYKLWKELDEIKQGVKYNPYYVEKLRSSLSQLVDKEVCNRIITMILNSETQNDKLSFYLERNGVNTYIYI